MYKTFTIIAAVGVMAIGGYFMFNHLMKQAAEIRELEIELKHLEQAYKANKEATMDKDDIVNEEQKLKDAEILDQLIAIGIVRADNDR